MSPEIQEKLLVEFEGADAVAVVAKRHGIGRDRLTRFWKEKFGKESVRERANRLRGLAKAATGNAADPKVRAEALLAFSTTEPMKKAALRLGVHYTQIRKWWGEEFGDDEVRARGRRLQKVKAAEHGKKQRGRPRKLSHTDVPCEDCGEAMRVSAISAAKRAHLVCETCDQKRRGADTACPVCGFLCVGQRGLASHLRHAQDEAHLQWEKEREERELGVEGVDHVVCEECGHRAKNLWKHLETVHGTTPSEYAAKWPNSLWRTPVSEKKRLKRSLEGRAEFGFRKGATKEVSCPTCGQSTEVSLFSGPIHDLRCSDCKAEDEFILWKGKKEPQDFVSCRECGHRAECLMSHLRSAHPNLDYGSTYPGAPLVAENSGQHDSWSPYRMTAEQLSKFAGEDGKIVVARVCAALGCAPGTVHRWCRDFGFLTKNRLGWQKAVLDAASEYLKVSYEPEWTDSRIFNEETGREFHFDGFFPSRNLILEAHGEQHFYFIESWHKTHDEFERMQALDTFKIKRAKELGYTVKVVRYSDPIHERSFWKSLFEGDKKLWANKSVAEQDQDVERVLVRLRGEGFPEIPISSKTTAEFTKLRSQEIRLDEERFVRPYTHRGTRVCASFFPNRYNARYRNALTVREAWDKDTMLQRAIRVQLNAGHPTTGPRVLRALQMLCRTPSVFRPGVAKFVCENYCVPGGVVWDPCAGYGGRLFGAMAAGVGKYLATDVEPETVEGNRRLALELGFEDKCEILCARAEGFDPGMCLDLVFTSPPYFDLEVYGEASEEAVSYGKIGDWVSGFLSPIVERAYARLRPGGYLVLNLPSKPLDGCVLSDEAVRLASLAGFSVQDPVFMPVRRMRSKELKAEPLLVFRK